MTVFSEKVIPTFTSSDHNIIVVESFNEIFFDVFELEINGNKFVAEKVSEKDGKPIVSIPLTHNGQKKNVPFLLEKGDKTEVYYNESNTRLIRPVKETKIEKLDLLNLVESKIQKRVPLFEIPDVEKAVDNIKAIKESAVEYLDKCRAEYVEAQKKEIDSFENKKKQEIKKLNEEYRKNMVSEFLSLTENVKNQIFESNSEERSNYNDYIRELFVEYCQEIEDRVDNNYETAINSLESKVNTHTETIFADRIERIFENRVNEVEKIISANDTLTNKRLDEKITGINSRIDSKIDSSSKENTKNFESLIERYDKALRVLEESTIDTNNNFVKSTNKALSRIGNVKNELSEKIDKVNLDINTISEIQVGLRENIEVHKTNIKKYFNKKISLLDTKVTDVNEEYKKEVVSLIRESERKLLEEIAGIDTKLPTLILKEARTKKDNVEVSLEDIRKELENNISGRFSKEIVSLKRLIEMTSGGGGAGGGSGSQSLSFDENTALLSISPGNTVSLSALSGGSGGGGGGITVETDPIFTTWAQANSGNYDLAYHTILTGGNIGGNLNLTGYLSADSIRFNLGAGISTPAQGEIAWDATDETLHYALDSDTVAMIGQDQFMRVKVVQTVKKGQALYASGTTSERSGNIEASLFNAVSGGIDELYFIGLAAADMAINAFGFAITFGKLKSVSVTNTKETADSSSWPIGTVLYVSAKQAGFLTSVPPTAPNRDIPVAFVISVNGNNRGLFVRYEHGYHLDENHDVRTVGVKAEGDLLTWNNSVSAWENRAQTLSFNENTAILSMANNGNTVSLSALSSGPILLPYLPLSGGTLTGAVSTNQDIEITDYTKGIILRSPGSIKYRVTVSDAGELITTQI